MTQDWSAPREGSPMSLAAVSGYVWAVKTDANCDMSETELKFLVDETTSGDLWVRVKALKLASNCEFRVMSPAIPG